MSGLNELVEFLRARLDEDEAAARSIGELTAYRYDFPGRRRVETRSGVAELDLDQMAPVERDIWSHAVRFTPQRVLHEVEAKRRLLRISETVAAQPARNDGWDEARARHTLRILASVYVDHPDYDPTWELPGGVGTP